MQQDSTPHQLAVPPVDLNHPTTDGQALVVQQVLYNLQSLE